MLMLNCFGKIILILILSDHNVFCLTEFFKNFKPPPIFNDKLLMNELDLDLNSENIEKVSISKESHPFYEFTAFERNFKLNFEINDRLISKNFELYLLNGKEKNLNNDSWENCHYIYTNKTITAAISFCHENTMHGIILMNDAVLEILPKSFYHDLNDNKHFIRRESLEGLNFKGDTKILNGVSKRFKKENLKDYRKIGNNERPLLETALFFDEAGYNNFKNFFNNDINKMRDMLLAYMNAVQALYHHESAGKGIDITLKRMEIFMQQPTEISNNFDGERNKLLDEFCFYNSKYNSASDQLPSNWDIGLYISGLDFYSIEKGRRSGTTMGLATVGGICLKQYSCIIAELGTTNIFGKPYPSAGFTSVYILAHEIGHNLGMHHDSYENSCSEEGFIMSPSRGVIGETIWSPCSSNVINNLNTWAYCLFDGRDDSVEKELDHNKFSEIPGSVWTSKRQCEFLLKDSFAEPVNMKEDICQSLRCKTPNRNGYYFSGPALEGTTCGNNKLCKSGKCVKYYADTEIIKGEWSHWYNKPCNSGCLHRSKGYLSRYRECNNPHSHNTNEGCDGLSYDVQLCNDNKICGYKRSLSQQYANKKCSEFSKFVHDLDRVGIGLQAPHEEDRLWVGCAIFCKRNDTRSFYTPRLELNNLYIDPYFPDGTWCHFDGINNYYCRLHHCLPENWELLKMDFTNNDDIDWINDVNIDVDNNEKLMNYLSVDEYGRALSKKLPNMPKLLEFWNLDDYIDLPIDNNID